DYPIAGKVESIGPLGSVAQLTAKSSEIASSLTSTANLVVMGASPGAAVKGDMIGNQITLLLMLSGPQVALPEAVLKSSLIHGIPFKFGNPFEKWTASETCDLPDAFARNDLVCSIFGNYGEDLTVLIL